MALTIVPQLTAISSADSTTGWTGNALGTNTDFPKEGTACVFDQIATDPADIYYTMTATNLSGQHVRLWCMTNTFGQFTTTNSFQFFAYDGTNTAYWTIANDATEYSGGWKNILIYLDSTPTSGSVNSSAVTRLGIHFDYTGKPRRIENTWVDYLRYGDGLIAYGTGFTFDDIASADYNNGYGIVELRDGIYFLAGSLQLGRATEQTVISETGKVFSFIDANVSSTLYKIQFIGNGSTSTCSFDGCVFTSVSKAWLLDLDDSGISSLTFTGNTVQKATNGCYFLNDYNNTDISGNVFDGCGRVYPQGSKFENNTITNTISTTGSLYISTASEVANYKNLNFNNYSGKVAVYIDSTVTAGSSITLDNWVFDASGTDIHWAGTSGTLTINKSGNTNIDISRITTDGGTVYIPSASYTFTIKGVPAGAEYRIYEKDPTLGIIGTVELQGAESWTGGDIQYSYEYTADKDIVLQVLHTGYVEYLYSTTLSNTNSSVTVNLVVDDND